MQIKSKRSIIFAIVALSLAVIFAAWYLFGTVKKDNVNVRDIELTYSTIDTQSILAEFDNAELKHEGELTTFTGEQKITSDLLNEVDNSSVEELEELEDVSISYEFTYDAETNIVTITAVMVNELGEINIDKLTGAAFYDEDGNIDAVMNVNGEGILLSEMRDAGLIQNCGWFSDLFKFVAAAAVVVAVAAVCVATCGAAAPAVVGAGVAAASTASAATAISIAGYATITAAIAAGVAITVEMWEKAYPGIEVTRINNTVYASYDDQTKKAIKDITIANSKNSDEDERKIYFTCVANSGNPIKINLNNPYTCDQMVNLMRTGSSSVTYYMKDAEIVISKAFSVYPIFDEGKHYHASDIFSPDYRANRPLKYNPRVKINGFEIHSFWVA